MQMRRFLPKIRPARICRAKATALHMHVGGGFTTLGTIVSTYLSSYSYVLCYR